MYIPDTISVAERQKLAKEEDRVSSNYGYIYFARKQKVTETDNTESDSNLGKIYFVVKRAIMESAKKVSSVVGYVYYAIKSKE